MTARSILTAARIAWIIAVCLSAAVLYVELRVPDRLDTNITSLLPLDEQDPVLAQLTSAIAAKGEDRIGFMTAGGPPATAAEVLEELRTRFAPLVEWDAPSLHDVEELAQAYLPYQSLLLDPEQAGQLTDSRNISAYLSDTTRPLYGPSGGLYSRFIARDPLLSVPHFLESRTRCTSGVPNNSGFLEGRLDDQRTLLLTGTLRKHALDSVTQDELRTLYTAAERELGPKLDEVHIARLGAVWFAERIAATMTYETSILGSSALFLTVLLFLAIFRSPVTIALTMLPLFVGGIVATAIAFLIFPSLHVITLAFGSVLIGACTDYGLHYVAVASLRRDGESRQQILRQVFPGLVIGLCTTLISYAALLITPLPGLVQLACFSIAGLLASFITTVLFLPILLPRSFRIGSNALSYRLMHGIIGFARSPQAAPLMKKTVALLIVGLSITAAIMTTVRNDIRLFTAPAPELIQEQRAVQLAYNAPDPIRYLVIEGTSEEEVIERSAKVRDILRGSDVVRGVCELSEWIPDTGTQRASAAAVLRISEDPAFVAYRETLGLSNDVLPSPAPGPLSIEVLRNSPAIKIINELWVGATPRGFAGIARLQGIHDEKQLRQLISGIPGVTFIDRVSSVSNLLGRYRERAMTISLFAYIAIGFFMIVRYGRKRGIACLVPPILSLAATLTVLALTGGGINVFTIFAILLTLGLGVDFAIFFLEGEGHEAGSLIAITGSTITSVISTALLAMSSTPMLSQFGLAVTAGIITAMLAALCTLALSE